MILTLRTLPAIAAVAALTGSCSTHDATEHETHASSERAGEHDGDGEESGVELALTERYDATRNGARLILSYDADSNSFQGTVENTTEQTLERVRVEVHLSNGVELGPTTPADLAPGAKQEVTLAVTSTGFERWTAHPEVGSGEHGHGDERGGEHEREGSND